jgi:hypothetical protein
MQDGRKKLTVSKKKFVYWLGSPRRRRHFAAAASHILSSRSQPFSRRAAAAASHICVTAATPYFLANYNFHERKR